MTKMSWQIFSRSQGVGSIDKNWLIAEGKNQKGLSRFNQKQKVISYCRSQGILYIKYHDNKAVKNSNYTFNC
jgi:hypothetical protein